MKALPTLARAVGLVPALVLVLVTTLALPFMQTPATAAESPVASIADAHNRFALELYKQGKDAPGNFAISPYSVFSALAMTYAGARGQTETEMARVLHLPFDQAGNHAAAGALRKALLEAAGAPGCTLSVANRLWGQKGYIYQDAFLETTRESYGAELEPLDFQREPGPARQQINDWTLQQTRGKIRDLLPEGSITELTRLVLTNAIYMKAAWRKPFGASDTEDGPFHVTPTEQIKVPMMSQTCHYQYAHRNKVHILVMDYAASRQSMVILLPDEIDGWQKLESELTPGKVESWLDAVEDRDVELRMPRFHALAELELQPILSRMGMPSAFGSAGGADFSGIDGKRDLFISAVVHKAVVDVAEKGTEAAAATAVVATLGLHVPPEDQVALAVDHPFLFLIQDEGTGCILFMGRVVNPAL
jgi:serine protease inhibitor